MKEIGGYFELEHLISNEYHKNLIALNSGRNALIYILKSKKSKKIKKIYIPYYLCDSIYNFLKRNGYDYEFYRIKKDFTPKFEKKLNNDEYLYIVNYYGQLSNEKISNLKKIYKNIIIDNTHSFFQEPLENIGTVYNCRKWFGVPDGAYLSTDTKLNESIEKAKSTDKMGHLLGRFENKASDYYEKFQSNDEKFNFEDLKLMSDLTHNLLGAIDYEKIKNIRNKNYSILDKNLKKYNKLKLNISEVPFCYPLYIENGAEIRKALIKEKIYIPLLWGNVLDENEKNSIEYQYAMNILPIPCDQRYDEEDMRYIIETILKFIKNGEIIYEY